MSLRVRIHFAKARFKYRLLRKGDWDHRIRWFWVLYYRYVKWQKYRQYNRELPANPFTQYYVRVLNGVGRVKPGLASRPMPISKDAGSTYARRMQHSRRTTVKFSDEDLPEQPSETRDWLLT